jgi:tRNA nucleotidyltransferase (CCA-adding enzyme)
MSLIPADREQVAQQLQLPADSHHRLATMDKSRPELINILDQKLSIGQLVRHLQPYAPAVLLLVAITLPPPQGEMLQQYLSIWSQIKAPLNGNDLKVLGYRPGVQYKEILDAILVAALDGIVTDRQQAIEFIRQHYPLSEFL